jgi:PKD repeat protein
LPIQSSNGGVPVSGHPITEFYGDSLIIHFGSSVHFFDASAGIPTSWNWSITGPANYTSSVQNPVITFNTAGFYNVKLKVTNSYGSDSLTKTGYIKVMGPVMSSFSIISPPMFTRINVSPADPSFVDFIWNKASNNPLVTYNWGVKKLGVNVELKYLSNNNGHDSVASFRKSFLDTLAANFGTNGDSVMCIWRAWAYNTVDSVASFNSFLVTFVRITIGIRQISSEIPKVSKLYSNYPNPFNPSTTIKFDLSKTQNVKIIIYDILGKEVSILADDVFKSGSYQINWNASDYSSGIYFYRMETPDYRETRRMILLK